MVINRAAITDRTTFFKNIPPRQTDHFFDFYARYIIFVKITINFCKNLLIKFQYYNIIICIDHERYNKLERSGER